MNPDLPHHSPEELEASLTALLLGELAPEQAAGLRRAIEQDAALAALHQRLKLTIDLVREAAAHPTEQAEVQRAPLKLSDRRRQQLLAHFKTVTPREFARPRRHEWASRALVGVAAVVVGMAALALLLPNFAANKSKSRGMGRVSDLSMDVELLGHGVSERKAAAARLLSPAGGQPASARSSAEGKEGLERYAFSLKAPGVSAGSSKERLPALAGVASGEAGGKPGPPALAARTEIVLPAAGDTSYAAKEPLGKEATESSQQGLFAQREIAAADRKEAAGGEAAGLAFKTWALDSAGARALGEEEGGKAAESAARLGGLGAEPGRSDGGFVYKVFDPEAIVARPPVLQPPTGEGKEHARPGPGTPLALFAATPDAGQKRESVGVHELANADTQEVERVLRDSISRGGFRQDGRRRSLLGQSNPLTQRSTQQMAELPPGTTAGRRQYPAARIGDAYFATDPESRRVVTIPEEASARNEATARTAAEVAQAYGAQALDKKLGETVPQVDVGGGRAGAVRSDLLGVTVPRENVAGSGGFGGGMMGGTGGGMGGGISTVPRASKPAQPTVPQARLEASDSAVANSLDTGLTVAGKQGTTTPAGTMRSPTAGTQVARLTAEEASARGISVLGDVPLLGPLFLTNTASPSTAAGYYGGGAIGGTPAEVAEGGQTLDHGGSARPSAVPRHAIGNLLGLAGPPVKGLPAQEQAANGAATTPQAGQGAQLYSLDVVGNADVNKLKLEGLNLIPNPVRILPATPSLPAERYGKMKLQSKQQSGVSTEPAKAGRVDIALPSPQSEARPAQAESAGKDSSVLTAGVAVAVPSAAATVPAPEGVAPASSQGGKSAVEGEGKALAQQIGLAQAPKLVEENKAPKERAIDSGEKLVEAQKYASAATFARRYGLRAAEGAAAAPQAKTESDEAVKRVPAAPAAIPQPEVQARENAFSTFSLNVSDVSFKLAAASLAKGQMPEPATVRSEEFINAFDYRDPEAPPGVPVAFAWERARYPFAHNRDLLRFSLKTAAQGRQAGRALNLVLLLDNSGSMERADRVRIIHEALRVLAAQLQPPDVLSVVTFARTARLWVDGVPGNGAAQVAEAVSGLTPQGGTNLEEAMNLAYQTALRHYLANGINRVVLLTDGAANLGNVDPEALKQKVEAHRKQGVALDCFGIGWEGYNDDLLEVLSRNGDGRYGFVNTPEEAATEFVGQLAGALHVAAADVKVQVEFNPARVTAYRQVGYAKHQLTKEQFRDNSVDAAEIGAAESGNALYVIETDPRGDGPLGIVRVRYKVPGTGEYREQEWVVPYTGKAGALEEASAALRLAATASAFSEWLASSPFAGEVTPGRLLAYLSGVPEVYGADERPRRLEWMIRQAQSIAGR